MRLSPFVRLLAEHLSAPASRLVRAMSCLVGETPTCSPSRHCRDARVLSHTTTAVNDNDYTSPCPRTPPPRVCRLSCAASAPPGHLSFYCGIRDPEDSSSPPPFSSRSQVVLNDFYEWKFQPLLVPPPTLQEDMRRLVNNRQLSDVTFIVDGFPVYARYSDSGGHVLDEVIGTHGWTPKTCISCMLTHDIWF